MGGPSWKLDKCCLYCNTEENTLPNAKVFDSALEEKIRLLLSAVFLS